MCKLLVILIFVGAACSDTPPSYLTEVVPLAENCRSLLDATEDEANAMAFLRKDLFAASEKSKCVAECVLEQWGAMRDGSWLAVPYDTRMAIYTRVFADDPPRLQAAEYVVGTCHQKADEKFKGSGCAAAYDAIECLWRRPY